MMNSKKTNLIKFATGKQQSSGYHSVTPKIFAVGTTLGMVLAFEAAVIMLG